MGGWRRGARGQEGGCGGVDATRQEEVIRGCVWKRRTGLFRLTMPYLMFPLKLIDGSKNGAGINCDRPLVARVSNVRESRRFESLEAKHDLAITPGPPATLTSRPNRRFSGL